MLSNQLKNIAASARQNADAQLSAGQAQAGVQGQQAMASGIQGGQIPTKGATQQLAGAMTQQNQQLNLQAQQAGNQGTLAAAGQALQQNQAGMQQQLAKTQELNNTQISELQRQGALKQNSERLRQAKQMTKKELDAQKRMSSKAIEYDNRLSFLTRKQREDLASIDEYTKQLVFDNRLAFRFDEEGRKFSNSRQLADYVIASSKSDMELNTRLRDMEQAAQRAAQVAEHAHQIVVNELTQQWAMAEQKKDQTLRRYLADLQAKANKAAQRKSDQGANNAMIIGATVAVVSVAAKAMMT